LLYTASANFSYLPFSIMKFDKASKKNLGFNDVKLTSAD